jgi:hypothetical protein
MLNELFPHLDLNFEDGCGCSCLSFAISAVVGAGIALIVIFA